MSSPTKLALAALAFTFIGGAHAGVKQGKN